MDILALIVACVALVIAVRTKRTTIIQRDIDPSTTRDIAQQVVDRHEQNFHRR